MEHLNKTGLDPRILLNAADFFVIGDKERRQDLLDQGERLAPTWPH
ncbi:MAG TPA: hypothetical protein VGM39_05005 [Kofleriaceae bacterium]|jgi:hypothetical protein